MSKSVVFLAGILLVATGTFVACSVEQAEAKPKWEVEGHFAEACQCDVVCPCIYLKPASHATCNSTQVFQIDKGRYEDLVLDGLYVITAGSLPENHDVEAEGSLAWSFSRLYLDERANEQQQQALKEIFQAVIANMLGQSPGEPLSPDDEVKALPIEASVTLESAEAKIPDVLDFHTERLMKPGTEEPWEITDAAWSAEWLPRFWVGHSKTYKYTDAQEWDHSGQNALFGRFKANSEMAAFQPTGGTSQD
ncbi:MAG: DUF1326 domain-containing protein [Terriglobia bacterium]